MYLKVVVVNVGKSRKTIIKTVPGTIKISSDRSTCVGIGHGGNQHGYIYLLISVASRPQLRLEA